MGHVRLLPGAHSEGTYPDWIFGMTLAGRVIYTHPDGPLEATAGDVVIMRPGTPQAWIVPTGGEPWEPVWAVFQPHPHVLPWLQFPDARPGYIRIRFADPANRRRVARALKKAYRVATQTPCPERSELAMSAIEEALLWCGHEQRSSSAPLDPRVKKALEFLSRNVSQPGLRLADVVNAAGASRPRLMALFRRQIGVPPMEYLERERLRQARQLLESGLLRVKEAAAACGYTDAKHFARRFRFAHGTSPSVVGRARPQS
jgi:AraC family transcriptional regulator of arabinose operon